MTLNLLTFIVALTTLLVVLYQVKLMRRQTDIMNTQLEIMKKQEELLSRRADLIVRVQAHYPDQTRQTCVLSFLVENKGNKTAKDFYWHIYVPVRNRNVRDFASSGGQAITLQETTLDGIPHDHYSAIQREPLYPTRQTPLGTLSTLATRPEAPLVVAWQLVSEDGHFPPRQKLGNIPVDL